jgi:hypothetical protein
MTLDDLDRQLTAWKARVETAAHGLVDLRAMPTWEMLTGGHDGRKVELSGVTAERIGPSITALEQVWQDFGALSSALDRAMALRKQMPRFSGIPQRIQEIEALLSGLDPLLGRMNKAFIGGRDGLLEIDTAWKTLDAKMSVVMAFLDARRGETAASVPELRRAIEVLRPRVMSDPLGVAAEFEKRIDAAFARIRADIEKLEYLRKNYRPELARTRELLAVLGSLREQNDRVFAEYREKIAGWRAPEFPLPPQRIGDLSAQLTRLEKSGGDGACLELEMCGNEIRHLIAEEERTLNQNRAPLDFRRELRGRLAALKAKAHARGSAEDPTLVRLAQRANDLLYGRPTPIEEASGLVSQYEARLNGRV